MNIDGTTLILIFWFPELSAVPQKQEHKVGHNYNCFSLEKVNGLFSIIKIRIIIVSNKKIETEIFWGHEVLEMYF